MVEGKGFVGHVSNNRALLQHARVQNAAEHGTPRNPAQPDFWCRQGGSSGTRLAFLIKRVRCPCLMAQRTAARRSVAELAESPLQPQSYLPHLR